MAPQHTLARIAAATLLAVGAAGCSTAVAGRGEPDPAAGTALNSAQGGAPAGLSPTLGPTAQLDTASERRITCLLILPSLSKVIGDWNSYINRKGGSRESLATSLASTAALVENMLRNSQLPADDPVRGSGAKVAGDLALMAQTLRRGGVPPVSRFNADKGRLQASCPS